MRVNFSTLTCRFAFRRCAAAQTPRQETHAHLDQIQGYHAVLQPLRDDALQRLHLLPLGPGNMERFCEKALQSPHRALCPRFVVVYGERMQLVHDEVLLQLSPTPAGHSSPPLDLQHFYVVLHG